MMDKLTRMARCRKLALMHSIALIEKKLPGGCATAMKGCGSKSGDKWITEEKGGRSNGYVSFVSKACVSVEMDLVPRTGQHGFSGRHGVHHHPCLSAGPVLCAHAAAGSREAGS
jgi:hypothetical protein